MCRFLFGFFSSLRSTIAGSCGKSMLIFIRNHQTNFQSGCTLLHPRFQWMRVLLFHILASIWCCIFDFDHSHRCMVYFIVVLICSLLMIPDVGHLFMFICQSCIFLGEISVHIFCPFLNKIVHCWIVRVLSVFWTYHFLIRLFFFNSWVWEFFVYCTVLTNLLLGMKFANIFFCLYSMFCHLLNSGEGLVQSESF